MNPFSKTTFTFEPRSDGGSEIYAQSSCGRRFHIGVIVDAASPNPLVDLRGPFGMNGLVSLVEAWRKYVEENS